MNNLIERLLAGPQPDKHSGSIMEEAAYEITRLRKIEAAAVKLLEQPQWNSDEFYDLAHTLDAALKEG